VFLWRQDIERIVFRGLLQQKQPTLVWRGLAQMQLTRRWAAQRLTALVRRRLGQWRHPAQLAVREALCPWREPSRFLLARPDWMPGMPPHHRLTSIVERARRTLASCCSSLAMWLPPTGVDPHHRRRRKPRLSAGAEIFKPGSVS